MPKSCPAYLALALAFATAVMFACWQKLIYHKQQYVITMIFPILSAGNRCGG